MRLNLSPEQSRELLPRIDPRRVRSGLAVGLRGPLQAPRALRRRESPRPRETPMKVALYARPIDAEILANLRAYAARRGWEVLLECTDPASGQEGAGKGLRSLREAVRARAVQGVLVSTLSHLARSLRHLTDLGHLLAENGVALIALEDGLDTREPGGAIRWRNWLETPLRFDRQLRAEAARLAHLRATGANWGRPPAASETGSL